MPLTIKLQFSELCLQLCFLIYVTWLGSAAALQGINTGSVIIDAVDCDTGSAFDEDPVSIPIWMIALWSILKPFGRTTDTYFIPPPIRTRNVSGDTKFQTQSSLGQGVSTQPRFGSTLERFTNHSGKDVWSGLSSNHVPFATSPRRRTTAGTSLGPMTADALPISTQVLMPG
jgi:hypothetical protein